METAKPGFRQKPQPTKAQEAKAKSALDRIADLEQSYQSLVDGINSALNATSRRVALLERAMGAVIELVGIEEVQRVLDEKAKREQAERDASLKALTEKAVQDGEIAVTDKIDTDSLIVGVEKDAEGNVTSGRAQIPYKDITQEFAEQLLGQSVGAVIVTKPKDESGKPLPEGTFEVLEIYKILPKKEPEAPADPERGDTHADQTEAK